MSKMEFAFNCLITAGMFVSAIISIPLVIEEGAFATAPMLGIVHVMAAIWTWEH